MKRRPLIVTQEGQEGYVFRIPRPMNWSSWIIIMAFSLGIGRPARSQSFFDPADTFRHDRFWISAETGTAIYGGVMIALQQAGYANAQQTGFDRLDDGEGHLYGEYAKTAIENGEVFIAVLNTYQQHSQFLLSPDIKLTRITVSRPVWCSILHALNFIKIPAPTLPINPDGHGSGGWLYF